MNDGTIREHLISLLTEEEAHLSFKHLTSIYPAEHYGTLLDGQDRSAWQLVDHLRFHQHDLLESIRNPDYVPPNVPEGYWPEEVSPPTSEAWKDSVSQFMRDQKELKNLIADESIDLFAELPHGDGQTVLGAILDLVKHNYFHTGQIGIVGLMCREGLR